MLTVENTIVEGWEQAIRGMRNPMNSWGKSDSLFYNGEKDEHSEYRTILGEIASGWHNEKAEVVIGPNDAKLMKQLRDAGKDHAKYRRMITVWMDVTGPFYWWKEFDTYKVGTVANSCSTMHKIAAKEFELEDFSYQRMNEPALQSLKNTIQVLEMERKLYNETKDIEYWDSMIQLLPSSYNQKRTIMLNYEVLANIFPARRNHKLPEWHTFCDWIRQLPESWIIMGEDADGT